MDCATEEQIINNRLGRIKGVENLEFDLMNRVLSVRHQLADPTPLVVALNSIGMAPEMLAPGQSAPAAKSALGGCCDSDHSAAVPVRERWLMAASGLFAVGAESYAWITGQEHTWPVVAMAIASIALGGRETLRKGFIAAKTLTLNINFLMTLAIVGAAIIGEWPEAAMVVFLFGIAEMVESFSLERARNAIHSLMELAPEVALVRDESGAWTEINADAVGIGDQVRVRPGERIPLDGTVYSGASTVNQAPITGESMPVRKEPGDPVYAGTVNETGSFEFEVTANSGNTTLARIILAVQAAQSQKAPTQRFVDRFARVYTPIVVVLAILIAAIPPLVFGASFHDWLYRALVLLVIACPCALVISTPVTVVSALATAARRGILVKGGIYIEEGRRIEVVALDKTGTVTHGTPTVTDVIPLGSNTESDLLRLAASLDAPSEHPVARAILAAYSGPLAEVQDFESITGRGVRARMNGVLHYIGNHRLAHEIGTCSTEIEAHLEELEGQGKTVVIVANKRGALGILAVADTVRTSSVQAVRELHELGIRTLMLTGDNARTARSIAAEVGIDDVRGDLLPEQKLEAIEGLILQGRHVGMVGDGINDAPALAQANIGFAMGTAGTDTAIETADVALMKDDLRKVPEFIRLSRRATTVLKQNIAFAIGIKVVFFALAFAGIATLWMAVFADMGASLIVVANGLRLLRTARLQAAPSSLES